MMKKLAMLFFLCTFSCYSQVVTKKQRNVLMTFGYLHNQQETLKHIKFQFPQLSEKIDAVESLFNKRYGISRDNIELKVTKIYGNTFDAYVSKIKVNLRSYLKYNNMTHEESLRYIEHVKMRSKGFVESPILETLNQYKLNNNNIIDTPLVYFVESYANNVKLKFSIEIPKNWKELDGQSTSVLKLFRSNHGDGNSIISIQRSDNPNNLPSLTEKMLVNSIPKNSQFLASYKLELNDEYIDALEYKEDSPNTESSQKRITTRYYIVRENSILIIDCSTYGTNRDDLDLIAEQKKIIYESIVKSIHVNKISEKNIIATRDQN